MNDTEPRASRLPSLVLAALGLVMVGITAWHMYVPGASFPEQIESELAAVFARRAAPPGAEVTVVRSWDVTMLQISGVAARRDQNALILVLSQVQSKEEWRPIQIEFAPAEGAADAVPRVAFLEDGQLLD